MDRDRVLQTLREHEADLKAAGVEHLRLFGSVARDEMNSSSDVDLLAQLDRSKIRSLIAFASLQAELSEILGAEVDLSEAELLRPSVKAQVEREAILAF